MNLLDERRGVPSASGMERVMNCPASFDMERHCADTQSEDAASGTRIHAVLACLASSDTLNSFELETCDMCTEQSQAVLVEWASTTGDALPSPTRYERRLGMTSFGTVLDVRPDSKADFVFTGQADVIMRRGAAALVIDYKTGRGDTPVAQDNPQLAALAVLVWKRLKVSSVRVAIVQPWAGKPTVADYTTNALILAESWLQNALLQSSTSTPEDTQAGDWCKWCKAKSSCIAYRQATMQVVESIDPMSIAGMDGKTQRAAMFARAMEMPAERLAGAMRGLDMVERFVDAIRSAAKERADKDVAFQQYYTLREKAGRRSVNDVGALFSRCSARGVTADKFTAACKIGIGDTEDVLRKATGLGGKALKKLVAEILDGLCDTGNPIKELVAVALQGGGE